MPSLRKALHIPRLPSALLATLTVTLVFPLISLAGASSTTLGSAERTLRNITNLLTGNLATAGFMLFIVAGGLAWWITRAQKAGQMLGRGVIGAVIVFGASQIVQLLGVTGAAL